MKMLRCLLNIVVLCSVMSDSLWPMDCSAQVSSIHGIFPARILEWMAISFSRDLPDSGIKPTSPAGKWILFHWTTWEILLNKSAGGLLAKLCLTLATPWAVACQVPLSIGFSRQEEGLPFPSLGDLPDPEIKPRSPAFQADSLPLELQGKSY